MSCGRTRPASTADELCQPRSLPPDRPAACPPQSLGRRAGSPRGDRTCAESGRNRGGCGACCRPAAGRRSKQHVGYYLVDRGRAALEAGIGYRPTWYAALGRFVGRAPLASYLGAILLVWLLTVIAAAVLGVRLEMVRIAGPAAALVLLALFAGAAGQFAVSLVNWLCTLLVPPRPMMRLDFSAGIPAEHRTLVAVPALLTSEQTVRDLVEQLELRYLANQDDNLWFALLSDFPDADQETVAGNHALAGAGPHGDPAAQRALLCRSPGDLLPPASAAEVESAAGRVDGRRAKTGQVGGPQPAAANRRGRCLQCHDRRLAATPLGSLRDHSGQRHATAARHRPRAGRLCGPSLEPGRKSIRIRAMVVAGYAVLQPRVTATMPEAHRSRFSRLVAGDAGIDPYTLQTSDLYHDLFGQGSFIGKGIYDVEAFESACEGRFPENRLLSHDLIEGCFARSGLVNDVELFEGVPSRLLVDMNRRHRWIRGDWQIASWLGNRVPTLRGNGGQSALRAVAVENPRQLAAEPHAGTVVELSGAGLAAGPGLGRHLYAVGPRAGLRPGQPCGPARRASPAGRQALDAARRRRDAAVPADLARGGRGLVHSALHGTLSPRCHRPHAVSFRHFPESLVGMDHRQRGGSIVAAGNCAHHYKIMAACTASSVLAAALLLVVQPPALLVAGPVLLAWLAGPLIAWWISLPYPCKAVSVTGAEQRQLGRWARQTWHYFDSFAGEADHWLPPDHVQGDPPTTVASRTSPTNIGLALLSGLTAYDLGYLPAAALLDRTGHMLQSMLLLERHRGHFYNWYNTRTLQPAEPRYVSSVDSGNLWGALTVLSAGLEELRNRPLIPPRLFQGLQDTVEVIADLRRQAAPSPVSNDPLDACIAGLREECSGALSGGARQTCERLRRIRQWAEDLAAQVSVDQPVLKQWTLALVRQSALAHQHLSRLAFWTHFAQPTNGFSAECLALLPPLGRTLVRPSMTCCTSLPLPGVRSRWKSGFMSRLAWWPPRRNRNLRTSRNCYAWFERLDAGCTFDQVLQAAEQIAEGHAWQLEAAEEDALTLG